MNAERSATICRTPSRPDGTFGNYRSDSGFNCVTVELPWRDNQPDISCVPAGRYLCAWRWSDHHKCNLYHIENVPGRSECEIHAANLAEQLRGCAAPGNMVADFTAGSIREGVPAAHCRGVTKSMETLAALEKDMLDPKSGAQSPFWLTIE